MNHSLVTRAQYSGDLHRSCEQAVSFTQLGSLAAAGEAICFNLHLRAFVLSLLWPAPPVDVRCPAVYYDYDAEGFPLPLLEPGGA